MSGGDHLEAAICIAVEAHRGQRDKAGQPYILHCLRVMQAVASDDAKIVAVLHDLLEDTAWTVYDLHQRDVPTHCIAAISTLTKLKVESYDEYIARVMRNPLACRVKMADLQDNMNLSRLDEPTEADIARTLKYARALARINSLSEREA